MVQTPTPILLLLTIQTTNAFVEVLQHPQQQRRCLDLVEAFRNLAGGSGCGLKAKSSSSSCKDVVDVEDCWQQSSLEIDDGGGGGCKSMMMDGLYEEDALEEEEEEEEEVNLDLELDLGLLDDEENEGFMVMEGSGLDDGCEEVENVSWKRLRRTHPPIHNKEWRDNYDDQGASFISPIRRKRHYMISLKRSENRLLAERFARKDASNYPIPLVESVEMFEKWKWRSDTELAEEGLFRVQRERGEEDYDIGISHVGLLFDEDNRSGFARDDELWAYRFNELVSYKQQFGDDDEDECNMWEYNKSLAHWVYTQRKEYAILKIESNLNFKLDSGSVLKKGKPKRKSRLTAKRIEALDAIGFVWNDPLATWDFRMNQLQGFHDKYGHCNVPESYDPALARWIVNQRQKLLPQIRRMEDLILPKDYDPKLLLAIEKIRRLDDLGYVWQPNEDVWNRRYEQLNQYVKQHGHALVCRTNEATATGLAAWTSRQRRQYRLLKDGINKRSTLTQARIRALDKLGFVWDIAENRFEQKLFELTEFKKVHGHCLVPYKYESNSALGVWVSDLRAEYKKLQVGKNSRLRDDHVKALNELGFDWEQQLSEWDDMLQSLKLYKDQHGDVLVPQSYKKYPKLGRWVNTQRAEFKKFKKGVKCKITEERIEKLEEIGFVWNPTSNRWKVKYDELFDYFKENGNTLVPRSHKSLGRWVDTQRQLYRKQVNGDKSSMTPERIRMLEDLNFQWTLA